MRARRTICTTTFDFAFSFDATKSSRFAVGLTAGFVFCRLIYFVFFGLRVSEKFLYEYDFGDHWQHLIRVESILPPQAGKTYPLCIGGKRCAPPEACGGTRRFLELRRQHSPFSLLQRVAEILEDEDADRIAELRELSCWLLIDRFDRRSVNRRLKQHFAVTDKIENTTERGDAR